MNTYKINIEVFDDTSMTKVENIIDKALCDNDIDCAFEIINNDEKDYKTKILEELTKLNLCEHNPDAIRMLADCMRIIEKM